MEKCTYTVKDIKEVLGIGINQAYDFIKEACDSKKFPVKKIGTKYLVPIKSFDTWLEKSD